MTKTDTSREAVERIIDRLGQIVPSGPPTTGMMKPINPSGADAIRLIRAILTERDALQVRAERAEAESAMAVEAGKYLLRAFDNLNDSPRIGPVEDIYLLVKDGSSITCVADARATLAQLDAEPAGVSEPAGVKVKPLEWEDFEDRGSKAQAWRRANYIINRWSDGRFEVCESYPGYQGDSIGDGFYPNLEAAKFAAQADYEQRILAALEPGQTHREGWEQCKEAAAELAQSMHSFTLDREGNATGVRAACPEEISEAIRAMKYPGDSQ